jgi:hypothetical protein
MTLAVSQFRVLGGHLARLGGRDAFPPKERTSVAKRYERARAPRRQLSRPLRFEIDMPSGFEIDVAFLLLCLVFSVMRL